MHDRLANLLGAAALTIGDRLTHAAAAAAGTSVSGSAALTVLAYEPRIGVTELGARIGLSQPAAARMLDSLAAAGLVVRERTGRSVPVRLTDAGRAAAERVRTARQAELARMVGRLAPEQRDGLETALISLLDSLYDDVGSEHVVCRLCDRDACLDRGQLCPVGRAARERGGHG